MIPLSTRMRPNKLEDFIGQTHFMYKGSLLYNSIKNKNFDCAIFYGPSGTGKTTLARIISNEIDAEFKEINATVTGTKELKEIIEGAQFKFYGLEAKPTYLYIDEIHRWNKLQQDSLLKAIEDGVIKFIGSTTENPFFSINNALLSRVRNLYEFRRLSLDEISVLIERALKDKEKGFGNLDIEYDSDAVSVLSDLANGDARVCLDTIGFIIDNSKLPIKITKELIGEALQRKIGFYSKGDERYNLLSALQKSVRGSDPDAAIHYFSRLVDGGADIQTIGRRLMVMASEDIGMAYPSAISIVTSCVQAALMIGYPEAAINLAQAVILLASAPKSNASYMAYKAAIDDIHNREIDDVPDNLKDSHYSGAKKMGYGSGYKYPHDYGGYVKQQYLPDNLYNEGRKYYNPTENGSEKSFKKYLNELEVSNGNNKSR